jgi:hypothetical protein
VDGFRYDMAEMVPYEFWSYMNSAIKMQMQMLFYWQKYNLASTAITFALENGLFI